MGRQRKTQHNLWEFVSKRTCAAWNCPNSKECRGDVSFFSFSTVPGRRAVWAQNVGRLDLIGNKPNEMGTYVLCSLHFHPSQYRNKDNRDQLIWNAVPSVMEVPGSAASSPSFSSLTEDDSTSVASPPDIGHNAVDVAQPGHTPLEMASSSSDAGGKDTEQLTTSTGLLNTTERTLPNHNSMMALGAKCLPVKTDPADVDFYLEDVDYRDFQEDAEERAEWDEDFHQTKDASEKCQLKSTGQTEEAYIDQSKGIYIVERFREYCSEHGHSREFEGLKTSVLDNLLAPFILSTRRHNGQAFVHASKVAVIRWLIMYITRTRTSLGSSCEPLKLSMETFEVIRANIQPISEYDLKQLYGKFNLSNPTLLQDKVMLEIIIHFYPKYHIISTLHSLTVDDFIVAKDDNDSEYIYHRHIGDSVKMWSTKGPHCPIASFKLYLSKLPPRCSWLWLYPSWTDCNGPWYRDKCMKPYDIKVFMQRVSWIYKLSKCYSTRNLCPVTPTTLRNVMRDVEAEMPPDTQKCGTGSGDMVTALKDMYTKFDSSNPALLQDKVMLEILINFPAMNPCAKGQPRVVNDFAITSDQTGLEYIFLRYKYDFRLYATKGPRCPVASYKLYVSKLNLTSAVLWQSPSWTGSDGMWYSGSRLPDQDISLESILWRNSRPSAHSGIDRSLHPSLDLHILTSRPSQNLESVIREVELMVGISDSPPGCELESSLTETEAARCSEPTEADHHTAPPSVGRGNLRSRTYQNKVEEEDVKSRSPWPWELSAKEQSLFQPKRRKHDTSILRNQPSEGELQVPYWKCKQSTLTPQKQMTKKHTEMNSRLQPYGRPFKEATIKRPFKCCFCPKTVGAFFSGPHELLTHLKIHKALQPFSCICRQTYENRETLLKHMSLDHGSATSKGAICMVCRRGFPTLEGYRTHRRKHDAEQPYECSMCHARYDAIGTLHKHLEGHRSQTVTQETSASARNVP